MADNTRKLTESGVPAITPKRPREPFFSEYERNILGFELWLLVAAAVLTIPFSIVFVFLTSIKW